MVDVYEKQQQLAEQQKARGDKSFIAKKDKEALLHYNAAIQCVPMLSTGLEQLEAASSNLLALCLSNRSAVLFQLCLFKECLSDLELCLPIAPEHLCYKLLHRLSMVCLKLDVTAFAQVASYGLRLAIAAVDGAMKLSDKRKGEVKLKYQGDLDDLTKSFPRSDGSADLETELSSLLDENTSFSSKLAYLLRCYSSASTAVNPALVRTLFKADMLDDLVVLQEDSSGRFMKTQAAIPSGTVLWQEQACAVDINPAVSNTFCHCCVRRVVATVPCPYCCVAVFCSQECLQDAWSSFHWLECHLNHRLHHVLSQEARFALRLFLASPYSGCDCAESRQITDVELKAGSAQLTCSKNGSLALCSLKPNTKDGRYQLVQSLVSHKEHRWKTVEAFQKEASQMAGSLCDDAGVLNLVSSENIYGDHSGIVEPFQRIVSQVNSAGSTSAVESGASAASSISDISGRDCCKARNQPKLSLPAGGMSTTAAVQTFSDQLLHYMLILQCNGHAIVHVMTEEEQSLAYVQSTCGPVSLLPAMSDSSQPSTFNAATISQSSVRLALAVFPATSLLNHSCRPNTHVRFDGNVLSLVSTCDIPAGSEITHCYGPDAVRFPDTDHRRDLLRNQYFFECSCCACCMDGNGSNLPRGTYACPTCKDHCISVHASGKSQVTCSACNAVVQVDKLEKLLVQAKSFVKEACSLRDKGQYNKSYTCLQRALKIQGSILASTDITLGYTYDCLASVLYSRGDLTGAVEYSHRSLACVQVAYGKHSVQTANEYMKLCQLLFNSGNGAGFLQTAADALAVLSRALGEAHEDTQQLKEMIAAVKAALVS